MLRNYLTIAWRNMLRQKGYTLINVIGLAIGLATCILILRYIQDELSFDAWHPKGDRIYRVLRETRSGGDSEYEPFTSGALAGALEQDLPEVEKGVRIWTDFVDARYGDKNLQMRVCAADTQMFSVLDLSFVNGSVETAFPNPSSIAITESAAKRVFGDEAPIGKTISIESRHHPGEFTVTSILKDVPRNTTFNFDYVKQPDGKPVWTDWAATYSWRPIFTYVLLREGADLSAATSKLPDLIERYMGPNIRKNNDYHFQPIRRIHLYSRQDYNLDWYGDIDRVYQFSAIAFIVLAIACINFANLSTARSARRAGEVGLRKVTGAHRSQLITQFLGESIVTAFLGLGLAVIIVRLVIEEFNAFFRKQLALDLVEDPALALPLLFGAVLVGVIAGVYPALFLSAFQPTETLKGTFHAGSRGQWIRKALVVAQFAISIILIVGTGVIYQQMQYLRNKDLGFDMNQVVMIPIFANEQFTTDKDAPKLSDRYRVVKGAFLRHPSVLEGTAYRWWLGWGGGMMRSVQPEGHEGTDWRMPVLEVDEDFLDFYKIEVVAGRKFDPDGFPADTSRAFVINETAAELLGWEIDGSPEKSPVGKSFKWVDAERNRVGNVVGVVRDFHFSPLREKIGPTAMIYRSTQFYQLAVRINATDLDVTMAFLEETWNQFIPEHEQFRRFFWDEEFEGMYREEHRVQSLTLLSSGIAILLACMGLFALASYAVEERRKEIGVRKTLGASVSGVIVLVSKEFLVMVAIASVLASPLAWMVMRGWLDNFAYRTDLGPLVFMLSAAVALIIAQLTVTFHAYRAAQTDPVLALRDE